MSGFKAGRQRLLHSLKDDSGVAALLIAAAITIIAFTALTIFFSRLAGDRELARVQNAVGGQGRLTQAVFTAFLQSYSGGTYTLPCPDMTAAGSTQPTGNAGTCNATGSTAGILPWKALGLPRESAIDAYGNYYTYIVSRQALNLCDTAGSEITGSLVANTDLMLSESTGTRALSFVIIGHGQNRLGARSAGTNANTDAAASGSHEESNAAAAPTTVYADSYSLNVFDDEVFAPTAYDTTKICKSLTPGGGLNAAITENFDGGGSGRNASGTGGTPDATKFSGSTATVDADQRANSSRGNFVANFGTGGAILATNPATQIFDPRIRRLYVSAKWTPAPISAATDAGMSLATRATAGDRGAADDFAAGNGVTFRFFCGTGDSGCATAAGASLGATNYISIRENAAERASSFTNSSGYTLTAGKTYIIEAYDDGLDTWARITQEDAPTNTAYVSYRFGAATDTGGSQQLLLINHAAQSYIDDFTAGVAMLALSLDGTGYAASAANTNNLTDGGDLTLETWLNPRKLPNSGQEATIVSKWDGTANSAFKLFLADDGFLYFNLVETGGTVGTAVSTGIKPTLNAWTHVAVSYDHAASARLAFYQNGARARTSTIGTGAGTNDDTSLQFAVGALATGGSAFTGEISDVRLWKTVRTYSQIVANYEQRLPLTGSDNTLVVNWKLDFESGGLAATNALRSPAEGSDSAVFGVGNTARYAPTLARYFRPFSTQVCPGHEVGAYRCSFTTAGTVQLGVSPTYTVPTTLGAVYAKVWGGGGGGYNDSTNRHPAGSGGFSEGRIQRIGNSPLAGQLVDVIIGEGGGGSSTSTLGGSGGDASVIMSAGGVASLAAGGGGGASHSATLSATSTPQTLSQVLSNALAALIPVQALRDTAVGIIVAAMPSTGAGGDGAPGGGATVPVIARADDSSNSCGGRSGNFTFTPPTPTPPTTNRCNAGGADPDTSGNGGNASGGGVAKGGVGYIGTTGQVGAGGGGGGVTVNGSGLINGGGGEAGGYATSINTVAGDFDPQLSSGFGGGGGAGYYDNGDDGTVANPLLRIRGASGAAGTTANAGGNTDLYYPGTAGRGGATTGALPVTGSAGAVILFW